MIYFRIRDFISVMTYRLQAPIFGRMGKRVRIVRPLRIVGARYCQFDDGSVLQVGAYLAAIHADPARDPVFRLGARTMIGNHAHIIVTGRVEFGEAVLAADRLYISDNRHEYADPDRPVMDQGLRQLADVVVGDGTWIGENVSIIGCRIGRNCVIGANSIVTRDVPDHCVVAGAPARIIKRYDRASGTWLPTNATGEFA